jgi:hypothetical protein
VLRAWALGHSGIVEGVVNRVTRTLENGKSVLRFVLSEDGGRRAVVELKGNEIRGLLEDGDRVSFASGRTEQEGVLRPSAVMNSSTGTRVEAWDAPLLQRAFRPLMMTSGTAAISTVATVLTTELLRGGPSPRSAPVTEPAVGELTAPTGSARPSGAPSPARPAATHNGDGGSDGAPPDTTPQATTPHTTTVGPPPTGSSPDSGAQQQDPGWDFVLPLLLAAVALGVYYWSRGRMRRDRGLRVWPVVVGIAIGGLLGALTIAASS